MQQVQSRNLVLRAEEHNCGECEEKEKCPVLRLPPRPGTSVRLTVRRWRRGSCRTDAVRAGATLVRAGLRGRSRTRRGILPHRGGRWTGGEGETLVHRQTSR